MRRTNSKATRQAVQRYLTYVAEMDGMDNIKAIKGKFQSEYGFRAKQIGERKACEEWLMGLGINVSYSYNDIRDRMVDFLDEESLEATCWMEKKGDGLYWQMLAKEILAA